MRLNPRPNKETEEVGNEAQRTEWALFLKVKSKGDKGGEGKNKE